MTNGANTLNYSMYTTAGRTTVWGDGTLSTVTQAGTGNGTGQALTVFGRVPTGQYVTAGSYTDTVTATVTY
jgi:spore coat protein U-like protein